MLRTLKHLVPRFIIHAYHGLVARTATIRYGWPSRKVLVIGVTGTKGKSTTVAMLAHCLTALGERVAFSSTVQWGLLGTTWPNRSKMTMPGRGELQKFLRRAVRAGCTDVVLEVSSEGLAQDRHAGIIFDAAAFLNLTPEHVESHGGFLAYRMAKEKLFGSLKRSWRKNLQGKLTKTVIAANLDDPLAFSFLRHAADVYVGFTQTQNPVRDVPGLHVLRAAHVQSTASQSTFRLGQVTCTLPVLGAFNVENALATLAVLEGLGYDRVRAAAALRNFAGVPGRMEEVQLNASFRVFVDYAHEPASLQAAYAAAKLLQPVRLLVLLGAQGGGRDIAKRSVMGALAAEHADVVMVTNEDPYDESPENIIADVATAAASVGKAQVLRVTDRGEAIARLLALAQPGDVLLLTGKGGEQVMAVAYGTLLPWDDRAIIKTAYAQLRS
ncbi:MAG: UDP-N-acetylmuramyl-tripeptide synthetase [Patescibacteria group bacterium]